MPEYAGTSYIMAVIGEEQYLGHVYYGKKITDTKGIKGLLRIEEPFTLDIVCEDKVLSLKIILSYSVFNDTDAIARSVRVINEGAAPIFLEKVMSGCLDMDNRDFDIITLHGSWARERHMQRLTLGHGKHSISSLRGESGHQEHPFLALAEHKADQHRGDVYGFHFVYSGNFQAMAEVNQFDSVRVLMGINPEDFSWKLEPGSSFQTPEMIMVYSCDGIGGMTRSLHDFNIKYVKWDMNRSLSDLGSYGLPSDKQGELYHRFVLGMYEMQENLLREFPDLLLENCSGGGARFDPGMLYYSPQIWCSDNTDAIERLIIQESTAMIYPLSAMGAHVSVCPNHTVGRNTPFETRGYVALAGTFGYELDVTKLSEEDKAMVVKQVDMYHRFNDLVREGDYYRLASYQENRLYDCFQVVSGDQKESLVFYVQVLGEPNQRSRIIRLKGLDPGSEYMVTQVTMGENDPEEVKQVYAGEVLLEGGIQVQRGWGDFQTKLLYFQQIKMPIKKA